MKASQSVRSVGHEFKHDFIEAYERLSGFLEEWEGALGFHNEIISRSDLCHDFDMIKINDPGDCRGP